MFKKLSHLARRRNGDPGGPPLQSRETPHSSANPMLSSSVASRPISEDGTYDPELSSTVRLSPAQTVVDDDPALSQMPSGSIGLSVVYSPETARKADIVFVHGLGGTSRSTWSKSKNPDLFWPLSFLSDEPDISLTRILTFGYNAAFRRSGNISTSILDFAKDLLFDLKYAIDVEKKELGIGDVPLLFVVHSMGGLIVKEAYIQGQNDPEYERIVASITAIAFLATPHRGTNLAQTLNRILQSSIITNPKQYISELTKNSVTLQKLNEQFRHIAPRLDIVSFYETQPTPIGINKNRIMVLEKESSVLGYPGETSKAIDANHQGICKYDSPTDPNYIMVRNVLRSLVGKVISANRIQQSEPLGDSYDLKAVLGSLGLPAEDYSFFRDQWIPATGDWIVDNQLYQTWKTSDVASSRLLWLNGSPASGKSVMASFIINRLIEDGACCQYFFIRFGDRQKRTLGALLRSIVYQLAHGLPEFRQGLLEVINEGVQIENFDPRLLWERLFKSILFKLDVEFPLFWIVDGLDEADDPKGMLRLLSEIPSTAPIKILLTGRKTSEMETSFQKLGKILALATLNLDCHDQDLRHYIRQELDVAENSGFKEQMMHRIMARAQNNFLWVRLAVSKINSCHTHADIEAALEDLPQGMQALYDRMVSNIELGSTSSTSLATTILQFVTCAMRPLTIEQLLQALGEEASGILDLHRSVIDLCGGFVVIDNDGRVAMIHQTAREYLFGRQAAFLHIDRSVAHEKLYMSCMRNLMVNGLRGKINRQQHPEFFEYAAVMWSSHLTLTSADSEDAFAMLRDFLTGRWVLTWIHFLAATKRLEILIQTSKSISKYSSKRKHIASSQSFENSQLIELELLDSWAVDFIKIVGKFGSSLRHNPESIYQSIPPFCPPNSAIYQSFGKTENKNIAVSGISQQSWDDSLSRISFGPEESSLSILASGHCIAVLSLTDSVFLFDASTFEEYSYSPIVHGEGLYQFAINNSAAWLATCGYNTTKLWKIATGECILAVPCVELRPQAQAMTFTEDSKTLLAAFDDQKLRSIDLGSNSPRWREFADLEEPEIDGYNMNSPNLIVFNEDGSLVAVAYRGHPMSAFETDGPTHLGHCWRTREELAHGEVTQAIWLPHSPTLMGLYIEGVLFKWNPYEDERQELFTGASKLNVNKDGSLLVTGDIRGAIKVYAATDFTLIYQLASPDTVSTLTFSPNSHRIYDMRGYYLNVWEPNVLIRYSQNFNLAADAESDSISLAMTAKTATFAKIDGIIGLEKCPTGGYYCISSERGVVSLHHTQNGKISTIHTSKGYIRIYKLTWSKDGKYLCFIDTSRRLTIKTFSGDSPPAVENSAEIPLRKYTKGAVIQLGFDLLSNYILVQTTMSLHVVSLQTLSVAKSIDLNTSGQFWYPHPSEQSLIMGISRDAVQFMDWDLQKVNRFTFFDNGGNDEETWGNLAATGVPNDVGSVLTAGDKRQVLVQFGVGHQEKKVVWFDVSKLPTSSGAEIPKHTTSRGTPQLLAERISSHILRCLSLLSRQRLVFISTSYTICSVQLPSGPIKEHFVLPGDWINRNCLDLCSVWASEKSFICPKSGELAIVKCAALG